MRQCSHRWHKTFEDTPRNNSSTHVMPLRWAAAWRLAHKSEHRTADEWINTVSHLCWIHYWVSVCEDDVIKKWWSLAYGWWIIICSLEWWALLIGHPSVGVLLVVLGSSLDFCSCRNACVRLMIAGSGLDGWRWSICVRLCATLSFPSLSSNIVSGVYLEEFQLKRKRSIRYGAPRILKTYNSAHERRALWR